MKPTIVAVLSAVPVVLGNFIPTAPPTQSPLIGSTPTANPTKSPSDCAVGMTVSSTTDYQCECETLECNVDQPAWTDSSYSLCGKCPDQSLDGAKRFKCPKCAPIGTEINITCPNHYEVCDVFLWAYNEGPCIKTTSGGWHQSLPGDWTASSCAKKFCGASTCQAGVVAHNTVSFHTQVLGGETLQLPETATDPSMYFHIIAQQGSLCGNALDSNSCQQLTRCAWNPAAGANGACQFNYCPKVSAPVPPKAPNPPLPPPGTFPTPRTDGSVPRSPTPDPPCCMEGSFDGTCQ